jgi:cytoskeletal protein RodZ
MPTVAELLRASREKQNLSIHDVADKTKIRTDHIRALESSDYNVFTAPVYIRGFVRNYASLLRLNVPEVMAILEQELAQTKNFSEPPPLGGRKKNFVDTLMLLSSRINWRIALPLGAILLAVVVGVLGYNWYEAERRKDPLKDLGPGFYNTDDRQSGDVLPLPEPAKKPG